MIHLVFKTHFDAGFTDLAENVLQTYLTQHIPHAIQLARQLRESGSPERFVWTTGSWLIYEFLERADNTARREMEQAIKAGDIAWHALPFTTHSELMSASLFRFGLGLSQELDRRFGRQTIAAKMTDVPGHTRAIIPLLEEAGVKFLHIGVNPACPAPNIPDIFRWRDPEGREIIVNYTKDSYGRAFSMDGFGHALAFAHSGDNGGPQSREEVKDSYELVRREFPSTEVRASTMDAFARKLLAETDKLPVVASEIGDTWIHGVGTDPYKTACFRRLDRLTAEWDAEQLEAPDRAALNDCRRELLCVPEHTWGLDEKTHLGDYVNYARSDFEAARQRDTADAEPPEGMDSFGAFRLNPDDERITIDAASGTYSRFESSWQEQRRYIDRAIGKLPPQWQNQAATVRNAIKPRRPKTEGRKLAPAETLDLGLWKCQLDSKTGGVIELLSTASGHDFANIAHPLFVLSYQTFAAVDYDRWLSEYNVNLDKEGCRSWAVPDFSKPGMEQGRSPSRTWSFRLKSAWQTSERECFLVLNGVPEAHDKFGMPEFATIELRAEDDGIRATVQWFDKPANRMAEALWLGFNPAGIVPDSWRMQKMGRWISPLDVVENGNRNLHAVEAVTARTHSGESFRIDAPDAPLVSPGVPRLLQFDNKQPPLEHGMHFNLYNNIWGTNFPMWYEEDARFEFRIPTAACVFP